MPATPLLALPFRDRPLDADELEALRLVLSTYRDGAGQNQTKAGSIPGFRDFERGLASIVGGTAAENKGVFDVLCPGAGVPGYGISCKMARFATAGQDAAFAELSNAAAKFRAHLFARQASRCRRPHPVRRRGIRDDQGAAGRPAVRHRRVGPDRDVTQREASPQGSQRQRRDGGPGR